MKFFKKNKELIIILSIIWILILVNFIFGARELTADQMHYVSGFSFWKYSLQYKLSVMLVLLSPQLIAIATVLPIYRQLKTGFINNIIVRTDYQKYMKKEIKRAYFKSLLILPLTSIVLLIIGILVFGTKIHVDSSYLLSFSATNPFLFFTCTTIGMVLYSLISINLALILAHYIDKFYLVMVALFLVIFFIAFFEGNFLYRIIYILSNTKINITTQYFELFYSTRDHVKWIELYTTGVIKVIITAIPVYLMYKDQESMVLKNET